MNEDLNIEKTKILIEDVEFSFRTRNILKNVELNYLEDLCNYTSRTILGWRGVGKRTITEIRQKLAFYGLALNDEVLDIDMKRDILCDLPKTLKEIKKQVDGLETELRFFGYKIDQIAEYASKTKKKLDKVE